MQPKNLLIIMADEHSKKMLGCYGHDAVRTPNLDRLAARGTRFANAYSPSPICVPARAAFATGRYAHQGRYWDNAHPFDGSERSWHLTLREAGHRVVSIGKLHFRGTGEDNGFSEEILPMHINNGLGDVIGLVRDRIVERGAAHKMSSLAGPGESSYTAYDREITAKAQIWLREEGVKKAEKPWALFVSLVTPHFPLTAPPEFYYRYDQNRIDLPKLYGTSERPSHPFLADYAKIWAYDKFFTPERVKRAIAGYYGLCSFTDDNVGKILRSLEEAGLAADTRVVYVSDHGDSLGARGLWGKSNMYEEAVGIPLIVSGPGIPQGHVVETPVSLLDVVPFILDAVGVPHDAMGELPGRRSLFDTEAQAPVFSEYHATGSRTGAFMIRLGTVKYVYYPGYPEQMFDLSSDPEELVDVAYAPEYRDAKRAAVDALYGICNPDEVDRQAHEDQAALVDKLGGVETILSRPDLGFSPTPVSAR
ncbi:MAG TPA: sulfatase-like hydrolase/transferase [Microvirga sp.]|jgi:choline-sulfatase|nr:sulfatase-like hydrolase/transferase [Microvirga sp.]